MNLPECLKQVTQCPGWDTSSERDSKQQQLDTTKFQTTSISKNSYQHTNKWTNRQTVREWDSPLISVCIVTAQSDGREKTQHGSSRKRALTSSCDFSSPSQRKYEHIKWAQNNVVETTKWLWQRQLLRKRTQVLSSNLFQNLIIRVYILLRSNMRAIILL